MQLEAQCKCAGPSSSGRRQQSGNEQRKTVSTCRDWILLSSLRRDSNSPRIAGTFDKGFVVQFAKATLLQTAQCYTCRSRRCWHVRTLRYKFGISWCNAVQAWLNIRMSRRCLVSGVCLTNAFESCNCWFLAVLDFDIRKCKSRVYIQFLMRTQQ